MAAMPDHFSNPGTTKKKIVAAAMKWAARLIRSCDLEVTSW